MKKILSIALALYLIVSACWSIVYNTSDRSWEIAEGRNGLLVVGFDDNGFCVLSPFCNHGDVYLFGMGIDDDGYTYIYSDGLRHFGEY